MMDKSQTPTSYALPRYHRVEGSRRASRVGRVSVSDLPPETLTLRFATFPVAVRRCGCGVDIASGPGMMLAGTYWPWGSGENCVQPADALFISGVQGLEIAFTEREQANMVGALAASKGYTAGNLFYSQVSSLGDAESSLGDAKSSLGDAESSLGDAESSLGDTKSSLGDISGAAGAGRVPARVVLGWAQPAATPVAVAGDGGRAL
jgi:hypothetical protein